MGRYLLLDDAWLLRGWQGNETCLVNWRDGDIRHLPEAVFAIACDCDGNHDFDSFAYTPTDREIATQMCLSHIAKTCDKGDSLHPAQAYRLAPNTKIRDILVSITSRCNFRCRHCYMSAPEQRFDDFSWEQLLGLLDQFEEANVPEIALTGGEPFVSPFLPKFLAELHERHIGISDIFTNASLITDKTLELLERYGFNPHFNVSFDGVGTHNHMRGVENAEEATIEGMRTLRRHGFFVTVISSLDTVVATSIRQTLDLLADIGVGQWWMAPPSEMGDWKCHDVEMLDLDATADLMCETLRYWFAAGRPFGIRLWRFGELQSKHEGSATPLRCGCFQDDTWNCEYTRFAPALRADGVLLPCSSYTDTGLAETFPNLLETPLSQAWDSPSIASLSTLTRGDVRAYNPLCQNCEHFSLCGSGCRNVALLKTGDYMKRDPDLCFLHRSGRIARFKDLVSQLEQEEEEADNG